MKIGLTSDLHLGFGEKEIYYDVFYRFESAIKTFYEENCDIIFILGDLFHTKFPDEETLLNTLKILNKYKSQNEKVKIKINGKEIESFKPAIIAMHGNHDRKIRSTNIFHVLEEALDNFFYVNLGKVETENSIFYLMSYVPERYAFDILYEKLKPIPIKNKKNFLFLHQNIYPFFYSIKEDYSLKIDNLPKGFDLIVDGHIHLKHKEKNLLFLGSPVITQLKKEEILEERGIWVYDIEKDDLKFKKIDGKLKYYYLEFNSDKVSENEIEKEIEKFESGVIKIKIKGKREISDRFLKLIEKKFENKLILKIDNESGEKEIESKIEIKKELKEVKTVDEIIKNKLINVLEKLNFKNSFDLDKIFEFLIDGDYESAYDFLVKEQKTIEKFIK